LQLEVIINDVPAKVIGSFTQFADGRIGATAEELESLGLLPGRDRRSSEIVMLDQISTLRYEYQERTQRILINVSDAGRKPQVLDLSNRANARPPPAQAGWGSVLNYDVLNSSSSSQNLRSLYFTGTSLTLNARAFSPFGTIEQSAIARAGPQQHTDFIRLNSSYRYSDPERLISYGAGDVISGGLAWSRPIRIGGLQAQSNFALRPDLITAPLPTLGGSAALPSTVDVYVNNVKTFSQDIAAGPFSVSNVPLITGAGNAELVIRDSAGHETRSTTPFYASGSLLAPGLMSWSVEAGLPRIAYGSTMDAYVGSPVGSATLRRGIYDGLTVEAHAEAGGGIGNGGVGAVFRTGTVGVATIAFSASTSGGSVGYQPFVSYETNFFGLGVNASVQRTFGKYDDLASATARFQRGIPTILSFGGIFAYLPATALPFSTANATYVSSRAPVALDRITFSKQVPFDDKASLSTSFVHLQDAYGYVSKILTASYSRAMPFNASVFATVFRDFGINKNTGVFAGLSVPFGENVSLSTGVSTGASGRATINTDAVKPLGPEPGSYGWRLRDSEGLSNYREASGSYRSSYGTVQAGVSQAGSGMNAALQLRGSITAMNGDVFLSNWIDDGFAVVSTGVAGVKVENENRPVGTTDSKGMLLLPSLRSYQANKISIDPANLPVDAEIATTREVVAPADRAGVLVKFDIRREMTSALVTFVLNDGSFVPAGASGRMADEREFVVGYDGQAFIRNLASVNEVEIEYVGGKCRASFAFQPQPGSQVQIPGVKCQ
jgi:outer membrane usher protein